VTNWLSFPACLCATGTRGFFVEAIKTKMFNVVSTTCGMLDHDIARAYKHYYHGAFELDDIELGEHQLMRLGNVIVPNSSYGEIIEAVVMPVLEDIRNDRLAETGKEGADAWLGFGSIHLVWELGKRIGTPDSLIYWAYKNKVPVCIPGITDGSIGAQLFMFRQKYRDFHIDTLADEQVMSDLTWDVEKSNALMVGGGISKHHVIWWNQYRGGLDSAIYITTAPEHDGSLSGARLREAISWGKMRPEAPNVCVEGDASVLLPLLGSDLFGE
jgi:deoxyhypusine synthase